MICKKCAELNRIWLLIVIILISVILGIINWSNVSSFDIISVASDVLTSINDIGNDDINNGRDIETVNVNIKGKFYAKNLKSTKDTNYLNMPSLTEFNHVCVQNWEQENKKYKNPEWERGLLHFFNRDDSVSFSWGHTTDCWLFGQKHKSMNDLLDELNIDGNDVQYYDGKTMYLASYVVQNPGHMLWDIWFSFLNYTEQILIYKNENILNNIHNYAFLRPLCANTIPKCIHPYCRVYCVMGNILGLINDNNIITPNKHYINYNIPKHLARNNIINYDGTKILYCFESLIVPTVSYNGNTNMGLFNSKNSLQNLKKLLLKYFEFKDSECNRIYDVPNYDRNKYTYIFIFDRKQSSHRRWENSHIFMNYLHNHKNYNKTFYIKYMDYDFLHLTIKDQFLQFYCMNFGIIAHGWIATMMTVMHNNSTIIEMCCEGFSWAGRGDFKTMLGIELIVPYIECPNIEKHEDDFNMTISTLKNLIINSNNNFLG